MADPLVDERSTTIVFKSLNNATRVFKNEVSKKMNELESEMGGDIDFSVLAPYAAGTRTQKMWEETGDYDDSMWSCSQSVGLINDVPTCRDLLTRMVKEAEEQLALGASKVISKL